MSFWILFTMCEHELRRGPLLEVLVMDGVPACVRVS